MEFTIEVVAARALARSRLKELNASVLPDVLRASWDSWMEAVAGRLESPGGGSGEGAAAALTGFVQANEQALEDVQLRAGRPALGREPVALAPQPSSRGSGAPGGAAPEEEEPPRHRSSRSSGDARTPRLPRSGARHAPPRHPAPPPPAEAELAEGGGGVQTPRPAVVGRPKPSGLPAVEARRELRRGRDPHSRTETRRRRQNG